MNKRSGFTLIETVLVLGIAGLIMLTVFMVLLTVWRNERDTERRDDIMLFVNKLKSFQTNNNRGALPYDTPKNNTDIVTVTPTGTDFYGATTGANWEDFYKGYFDTSFTDPSGMDYTWQVRLCTAASYGSQCSNIPTSLSDPNDSPVMYIFTNATCIGDTAVLAANGRKVAVMMQMEGVGTFCYNS